ncbi:hypothetical protein LAJ55_15600, partial [Streptococcus pneumoniae]|uniref:hypothetical protein n=1 Tax=Streptococcus pneumoniae TaxID=1313 RepID=UPI001CBFE0C5
PALKRAGRREHIDSAFGLALLLFHIRSICLGSFVCSDGFTFDNEGSTKPASFAHFGPHACGPDLVMTVTDGAIKGLPQR